MARLIPLMIVACVFASAGPVVGAEPDALKGHQSIVNSIAFSPDGATLASGGEDTSGGAIKL